MALQSSRIVVTGGAGFIGSHLVDRLLLDSHSVVVIDDFSSGSHKNLAHHGANDSLHIEQADILDENALTAIIRGADFVIHMACQNIRLGLHQPTLVHEVNVTGTLNVLKTAAAAKVKRFLYCSSSEVNGIPVRDRIPEDCLFCPRTMYGASKLVGEYYTQMFQRSGWLNTVVVRPYNNYGPREHYERDKGEVIPLFILRALAGKPPIIYGDGKQTRDFVYVAETADLLLKLLEAPDTQGSIFNICTGKQTSIMQIARLVCELTNSNTEPLHFPSRPSDLPKLCGDPSRLRRVLGLVPEISIREGIRLTIDWFRRNVPITEEVMESLEPENWKTVEREPWLKELS